MENDIKSESREMWIKTREEIQSLCNQRHSESPLVINGIKAWKKMLERVKRELGKSKNKLVRKWLDGGTLSVYFDMDGDLNLLMCQDEGVKGHSLQRYIKLDMHFMSRGDLLRWIVLNCIEDALDWEYSFYWEQKRKTE